MPTDIRIPDIGDFKTVPITEILVRVGDVVALDTPLLVLESDKATLEIPSPVAGIVAEILARPRDTVSQGSLVMRIETTGNEAPVGPATRTSPSAGAQHAALLVIGAGPGGYAAAFRAADLGLEVVLVERHERLGGVCLNVGCIPSKALLHAAKLLDDTRAFADHGIAFSPPRIDADRLRAWKDGVVSRLTDGLAGLARRRKVSVIQGEAVFTSPHSVAVTGPDGRREIGFDQAIIAAGSSPAILPVLPHNDPRIIDSTGALDLRRIDGRLLVVGGGIIGLEMATVYHALGADVTIVEAADQVIPGADPDLVAPLAKRLETRYQAIRLNTRVVAVTAREDGLAVRFEGPDGSTEDRFDQILVAVGRKPNAVALDPGRAGIAVDDRGFIAVDRQMRTNQAHIFAVGDVVGQPMLAHKATHQGKAAAEAAAGQDGDFAARAIPAVAYTDPEIAWVGLTETDARRQGIAFDTAVFPWAASGRSLSLGRDEGLTKLIFDPRTRLLLGAGIVGPNAGDLIAEAALALEMDADAADLALTIHPHPTLSETIALAAEVFEGTVTDLPPRRR